MVSVSLKVYYTKLHLQHPATALFTLGTSTGKFKTQYNNHAKFCRHREYMSETELSKHVWNLKDLGLDNNLLWEIHKKGLHTNANVAIYVCRKKCPLFHADPDTLLNKRTELISKCRHRNKFLMVNLRK